MRPGPVFILTFEALPYRCPSSNLKGVDGLVGLRQRCGTSPSASARAWHFHLNLIRPRVFFFFFFLACYPPSKMDRMFRGHMYKWCIRSASSAPSTFFLVHRMLAVHNLLCNLSVRFQLFVMQLGAQPTTLMLCKSENLLGKVQTQYCRYPFVTGQERGSHTRL